MSGDYGRALQRELRFDRELAERAREDLAEYLDEMAAAGLDRDEAERRFGAVEDIARSYASAALPARLRQTLKAAGWLALATFLFMRWRSIALGFDPFAQPTLLSLIDGVGFLIGAAALIVAWRRRSDSAGMRAPLLFAGAAIAVSTGASLLRALPALGGPDGVLILATGAVQLGLLLWLAGRLRLIGRYRRVG
ncbi:MULTISPECIES: hypothetical protein [unclassified Sphingopyxis]|uniref:hypothetical protein n=1 Tax=unclassified Sphingopyxis TaxID=2614943 RepID=UPI0007360831|nr:MULTISPECIES: hypothetical protein [unclassified Sphingopyxis]KTE38826.1 hypothetical protein ATE62_10585 [Sphingopyxis sp. HIX]KTE79681.1 hypothetical protein ATE72_18560 [Sphingopyxis sp. HXXIV]